MLHRLLDREINAELIAASIFAIIAGLYLSIERGFYELIDVLLLWMFPASIMFFLTLLIVKIIETAHEKHQNKYHYVDWRRKVNSS